MKRCTRQAIPLLAAVFLTAAAAHAGSSGIASPGEPHGVVRTDVQKTARQIFPVNIVEIDGDQVSVDDQIAVLLKPGRHLLKVRGGADMDNTFGLKRRIGNTGGDNSLEIVVESGKTYYVGGKVDRSNNWKPVVWKTRTSTAGDS